MEPQWERWIAMAIWMMYKHAAVYFVLTIFAQLFYFSRSVKFNTTRTCVVLKFRPEHSKVFGLGSGVSVCSDCTWLLHDFVVKIYCVCESDETNFASSSEIDDECAWIKYNQNIVEARCQHLSNIYAFKQNISIVAFARAQNVVFRKNHQNGFASKFGRKLFKKIIFNTNKWHVDPNKWPCIVHLIKP